MPSINVDEASLRKVGGLPLQGGDGATFQGWKFMAKTSPITKDAEMEAFGKLVGGPRSLPEQLFGGSWLLLTHEQSGLQLRFDALGALRQWHADNLAPLQVAHAEKWQRSRSADLKANNIATLQYDWTFTTSYSGAWSLADDNGADSSLEGSWTEAGQPIERSVLLAREPILFFAELPLYESELDDSGASQLSVKIRVMPSCWFILLRFWLRVDGLLVRLRDVRILHKFDSQDAPVVWREILHSEGTFEELSKAGAPANQSAYADADSSAAVLQAVAPVGCSLFKTEVLSLPPRLQ